MNLNSPLVSELSTKEYREAYVAAQINIGIPFQIRALRKSRGWNQEVLAEHAKMAQPRISEIERPGERRPNIETLLRIAAAFDVGLQVRFLPFTELIEWSESFDPENFEVRTFDDELNAAQLENSFRHESNVWSHRLVRRHELGGAVYAQFAGGQEAQGAEVIPFPLARTPSALAQAL